jgi:hypothetical protein
MEKHKSDLPAALTGLLLGAVCVLAIMFTIVQMVNSKFEHQAQSGQVSH